MSHVCFQEESDVEVPNQHIPCVGACICGARCNLGPVHNASGPVAGGEFPESHKDDRARSDDGGRGDDGGVGRGGDGGGGGDDDDGGGLGGDNRWGAGDGRARGERARRDRDLWDEKYGWNDPLLPNVPTTKFEALLMVLHIVMRHGMTGPFIEDILKFINILLGEEAIPTSQFIFKKLFSPKVHLQFHFYCGDCDQYLGKKESFSENSVTCECGSVYKVNNLVDSNFFVTFSVREQLEELFSRLEIKTVSRLDRIEGCITDILDGALYKKVFQDIDPVVGENALSITFNTDGVAVWSGPRGSMWPILYVVNELDPLDRFKPENVLLCALFYGKKAPNMSTFFTPFVKEMQELATNGVKRVIRGLEVICPVYATTCSLDLMAKCKVQRMKQCNGKMGCGYCFHPNDTRCAELSDNHGRYSTRSLDYPYPLRNHENMVRDMIEADRLDGLNLLKTESVNGVMGLSLLLGLPKADVCGMVVIDYMLLLKGVSEKVCEVLFDSAKYVQTIDVDKVSRRLKGIKPPHTMTRFPKCLKNRSDYKAKDWIALLLFALLPCVFDMLPRRNFNNLCDLVEGLHILLRDSLSDDDVKEADMLLNSFLRIFICCMVMFT